MAVSVLTFNIYGEFFANPNPASSRPLWQYSCEFLPTTRSYISVAGDSPKFSVARNYRNDLRCQQFESHAIFGLDQLLGYIFLFSISTLRNMKRKSNSFQRLFSNKSSVSFIHSNYFSLYGNHRTKLVQRSPIVGIKFHKVRSLSNTSTHIAHRR